MDGEDQASPAAGRDGGARPRPAGRGPVVRGPDVRGVGSRRPGPERRPARRARGGRRGRPAALAGRGRGGRGHAAALPAQRIGGPCMRIARVSLGATARGMTAQDDVASAKTEPSATGAEAPESGGHVYLRAPERSDRAEFISLMRASRAFHRPWATAPTDDEAFDAYVVDSRRPDFEAMLVCRRQDRAILRFFTL